MAQLEKNLKRYKAYSWTSWLVLVLSFLYLAISIVKGVIYVTDAPQNQLTYQIHNILLDLVRGTYHFPLSYAWDNVLAVPLGDESNFLDILLVVIPPILTMFVARYFITRYNLYRKYYLDIKAEINRENDKRSLQ